MKAGSFGSFLAQWRSRVLSRRAFLIRTAALSSAALWAPAASARTRIANTSENTARLNAAQQRTLGAVQAHLFPATADSPGAGDIRALAYFQQQVLADPGLDGEERDFLINGIAWLDEIAVQRQGAAFAALSPERREALLRQVAGTPAGENWIASILLYLFEALLCDPVYGGNPDGIGWKWLQHQPGFPRPPADKIYGRL